MSVTQLMALISSSGGFEHTTQDHGVSDWICMESGTATYSVPYAGTNIIESNIDGTGETTIVSNAAAGSRGSFSIEKNKLYKGSNAINLTSEGEHHRIAPITNRGTKFGHFARRNAPTTYYIYNPNSSAITVNVYDNVAGGISGTATTSISVAAGLVYSGYTNSTLSAWVLFEIVGGDAVMSAAQSGADRSLMSPADTNAYVRYSNRAVIWTDMLNSAPASSSTYTAADATNLVVGHTYADGAGGDDENGVGLNYLADRYSFGNAIGDYFIAAPYASTTATVKYWNGSSFATYATYSLNGSLTNPAVVQVGTTAGGGTALQGGATHWLWEADNPIFVAINDTVSDEESLLGWMADRTSSNGVRNGVTTLSNSVTSGLVVHLDAGDTASYPGSGSTWYDLTSNNNDFTLVNSPTYSSANGGKFQFNGSNQYAYGGPNLSTSNCTTIAIQRYATNNTSARGRVTAGNGNNWLLGIWNNNTSVYYAQGWVTATSSGTDTNWHIHAATENYSGDSRVLYDNNSVVSGQTATGGSQGPNGFSIGRWGAGGGGTGSEYSDCEVAVLLVYNRVLSTTEMDEIFNFYRGRFGV